MDVTDAGISEDQAKEAFFDPDLSMWVLSKYDDVLAAFQSEALRAVGPRAKVNTQNIDDVPRLKMRTETTAALSSVAIEKWRDEIIPFARFLLSEIAASAQVDLVREYARPLCEKIATIVTHPSHPDTEFLLELASQVSMAASDPFNLVLSSKSKECDTELEKHFTSGPVPLRGSGFVALSKTMPCLLARCWVALLRYPDQWTRLRNAPEQMREAVNELLRYAGLTRVLFRMAVTDTTINGIQIRAGDRLMLKLISANRDPAKFVKADCLDASLRRRRHVALGFGKHACVGAPIIRMIIETATGLLLERFSSATIIGEIEWRGGSGFLFPESIHVSLRS